MFAIWCFWSVCNMCLAFLGSFKRLQVYSAGIFYPQDNEILG